MSAVKSGASLLGRARLAGASGSVTIGVVALLLVGSVVALVGTGHAPSIPTLLDGGAWLRDEKGGVHVNGASGEPDARQAFRCGSQDEQRCVWVQRDGQVYVLNLDTGEAFPYDSAGRRPGTRVDLGDRVVLKVGAGRAYSVEQETGVVIERDPTALTERGRVEVGGAVPAAVVDRDGNLWAAVPSTGDVVVIDGSTVKDRLHVADPGHGLRLTLVGDRVVVLDQARATVQALTPSGPVGDAIPLGVAGGDGLRVPEQVDDGDLWVLDGSGRRLVRVDLAAGRADPPIGLPPGEYHEDPAVTGHVVLVRNAAAKRVEVYDQALRGFDTPIPAPDGTEVLAKDGYVYVNPRSGDAWVVDRIGQRRKVNKARPVPKGEDRDQVENDPAPGPASAPDAPDQQPDRRAVDPPAAPGRPPPAGSEPTEPVVPSGTAPGSGPDAGAPVTTPPVTSPPPGSPPPQAPVEPQPPGRPTAVRATAGDREATVTWTSASGATRYRVTGDDGTATCESTGTTCTVSALTNGRAYRFTVTASNSVGDGPQSDPSPSVTPSEDVPEPPTAVTATTSAGGTVVVTWTPARANRSAIRDYVLTPIKSGSPVTSAQVTASTTSATLTTLELGKSYRFQVVATNEAGASSTAAVSNVDVVPFDKPGAPTSVSASSANGTSITVSWQAGRDNGRPVTYQVETVPSGGAPATTTASSVTLPSTAGTRYSVRVTPRNEAGEGPPAEASVTTPDKPTVTGFGASAGWRTATVSFSVNDGGLSTTCTAVVAGGPSQAVACSGGSIGGLGHDADYEVYVYATNSVGRTDSGRIRIHTPGKTITVDTSNWEGKGFCAFCPTRARSAPDYNSAPASGDIGHGTQLVGRCKVAGGTNTDPSGRTSNIWVQLEQGGYINSLSLSDKGGGAYGLGAC